MIIDLTNYHKDHWQAAAKYLVAAELATRKGQKALYTTLARRVYGKLHAVALKRFVARLEDVSEEDSWCDFEFGHGKHGNEHWYRELRRGAVTYYFRDAKDATWFKLNWV